MSLSLANETRDGTKNEEDRRTTFLDKQPGEKGVMASTGRCVRM